MKVITQSYFDGSEEQMIRASATCTVTRSKDSFYYDKTNKATNLVVNFSFKWNGAPLFRGTDLMAVSNGERMYFHNNSYLNVSYQPLNSSGVSSSKKISASIDGVGNTGASFKFKVLGNNGLTYAKSGQGKVYLHRKNEDIKQVGVGVKYGHSTLSIIKYIMKYLIGSIVTIIIGYIFSGMLSGVGVSDAYMSYINEVTLSVIFLSGIVSFWGYLILDKLNKEKDLNEDIKNTCNKSNFKYIL